MKSKAKEVRTKTGRARMIRRQRKRDDKRRG